MNESELCIIKLYLLHSVNDVMQERKYIFELEKKELEITFK